MASAETGDGATTETTETTDGQPPSPPAVEAPSPYRPPAIERAWDCACGLSMMVFGGILVWRAIKPEEYNAWQSR